MGRETDALGKPRDPEAENYLTELKRFAAMLNGMPPVETVAPPQGPESGPVEVTPAPPISPPANLSNHEDEPARQVTAPIPAPSVMTPTQLPAADLSVSAGESDWWRALDARLARAPRRPRFAARRLDPRLPSVTRTAAPTHLPMPPPQLRRQIDAAQMPDEARGTGRQWRWDRLDTFLSIATLTVVVAGSIVASAPNGTAVIGPEPAATIGVPESVSDVTPAASAPTRPSASRGQPGQPRPLLPAPPPFPVTSALVSEGVAGSYLRSIGDDAFRPIALGSGQPVRQDAARIDQPPAPDLVDLTKADDVIGPVAPAASAVSTPADPRDAVVLLAAVDASLPLVSAPIAEPPAVNETLPPAIAEDVTVAATADAAANLAATPGWRVHLVSVRDETGTAGEWRRLQQTHAALAPMTLVVERADLGEKGIWYRVMTGPFDSFADATKLCESLTDQYCQPLPDKRG